jgi:AbrB family looped-hinge helix DNA binding protein
MSEPTRQRPAHRVSEALRKYIADDDEARPVFATISSKNQITLPARLLRELGIGPGDRFSIRKDGERLVLRPRPKEWADYYGGSMRGVYGNTKEEIEAYLRDVREGTGFPEEEKEVIEEARPARKPARG